MQIDILNPYVIIGSAAAASFAMLNFSEWLTTRTEMEGMTRQEGRAYMEWMDKHMPATLERFDRQLAYRQQRKIYNSALP